MSMPTSPATVPTGARPGGDAVELGTGMAALPAASDKVSGVTRAAILILRLGIENAGPLLKHLQKDEIGAIVTELARLGQVDTEMGDAVLGDFVEQAGRDVLPNGDVELAHALLLSTFGDRVAREIMSNIDDTAPAVPFQFLDRLEPADIAENLSSEHPQTIALILSHLTPDQAANIIGHLPDELVPAVGLRLGTLDRVAADTLQAVEIGLRRRFETILEDRFLDATGGVDSLVEVLQLVQKPVEESILDRLAEVDSDLANEVRAKMFVFADLTLLEDRQMQMVLRYVDANRLPLALKGVDERVKDKILRNLSSRAQENLNDEIALLGSVRMADVEEAQTEVLDVVRKLEETGELIINRGGNDFVS